MTKLDRRKFLAATAGTAVVGSQAAASADDGAPSFDDAIAVLYDATRCIGCRSCVRACRQKNNLPPDEGTLEGVKFDMPARLSANNWTVIQAYREDPKKAKAEGRQPRWSFVKKNCMHCNVPACASVCPVAALRKTSAGPVTYDESRCIGCRYCLLACPYHVPRYEWVERMPRVRKCNWNRACVRACPVGALVEGKRKDMVAEAHRRIREHPGRYVDHVYGEHEAGGTSYLIIAGVEHSELGLPTLPPTLRTSVAEPILKGLPGWIVGLGLFLGGLYKLAGKRTEAAEAAADAAVDQQQSRRPARQTGSVTT